MRRAKWLHETFAFKELRSYLSCLVVYYNTFRLAYGDIVSMQLEAVKAGRTATSEYITLIVHDFILLFND